MRLINTTTKKLEDFLDDQAPPYAILSHTWGDDCEELTLRDIEEGNIDKPGVGSVKLRGCCQQAVKDGLGYAWIDTCCIDKKNLVELSEAINSMYRWYSRATVCYAYLSDVPMKENPRKRGSKFEASRWFRRGWTLQELLGSKQLRFYDSGWHSLGTKGGLHTIISNITGIPRQFLLGITDLRTASIAQRMSWAAPRETKRKEDLAYCLLGIFGVSIPLIYGEGGEHAFFRLQEQILRTTRDDSILAWGLCVHGISAHLLGGGVPGRVLAAAPSDFLNSGQIVTRQPLTPQDSLELSGGSLRINLSLVNDTVGNIIGVLRCGPEANAEKAVGIPLVQLTLDEHVRPSGSKSMLLPLASSSTQPKLIYVKNDNQAVKPIDMNEQFWLYDEDEFTQVDLRLVEVWPQSCWHKDSTLFKSTVKPDDSTKGQIWARFRHREDESPDFVLVLGFEGHASDGKFEGSLMICSRQTLLEDLARGLRDMTSEISERRSASNGLIHLKIILEPDLRRPIFNISLEAVESPPDVTLDGTAVLEKSNIMQELVSILEVKALEDAEVGGLNSKEKEKEDRLELVRARQKVIEDEIVELERKKTSLILEKRTLTEQETNEAGNTNVSRHKQNAFNERQQHTSARQLHAQKRFDDLCYFHSNNDYYSESLPVWAAERGHIEILQMILNNGLSLAVNDRDGLTPLMAASRQGHFDVARLLLAHSDIDVDAKGGRSGQTALSLAAAHGEKAIVLLLLDIGNADVNSLDNDDWTPRQRALDKGHEDIAQLLHNRASNMYYWLRLMGHTGRVYSMSFSHDSKLMASASGDASVRIWGIMAGGICLQTLRGHDREVTSLSFSGDSKILASASRDETIRLWDTRTGQCQTKFSSHPTFELVGFSLNSTLFASATQNVVELWDSETQECLGAQLSLKAGLVNSSYLQAVASRLPLYELYNPYPPGDAAHDIISTACIGKSAVIAFACVDSAVKIWDSVTGLRPYKLTGHIANVHSVAFSHDSKLIASASYDGSIRLWVNETGKCLRTIRAPDVVGTMAFSHDSRFLMFASTDKPIELYRTRM